MVCGGKSEIILKQGNKEMNEKRGRKRGGEMITFGVVTTLGKVK